MINMPSNHVSNEPYHEWLAEQHKEKKKAMIIDDHLEYTSNGVPYYWQLLSMHGAAYTVVVNMDDPENILTSQQIAEAKDELLTTQDVARLSVVEYKNGEYKLIEARNTK